MRIQRAALLHALLGANATAPYALIVTAYFVGEVAGGIFNLTELVFGTIWAALYLLVPTAIAAVVLGGINIGSLATLQRTNIKRWTRAAIPIVGRST